MGAMKEIYFKCLEYAEEHKLSASETLYTIDWFMRCGEIKKENILMAKDILGEECFDYFKLKHSFRKDGNREGVKR